MSPDDVKVGDQRENENPNLDHMLQLFYCQRYATRHRKIFKRQKILNREHFIPDLCLSFHDGCVWIHKIIFLSVVGEPMRSILASHDRDVDNLIVPNYSKSHGEALAMLLYYGETQVFSENEATEMRSLMKTLDIPYDKVSLLTPTDFLNGRDEPLAKPKDFENCSDCNRDDVFASDKLIEKENIVQEDSRQTDELVLENIFSEKEHDKFDEDCHTIVEIPLRGKNDDDTTVSRQHTEICQESNLTAGLILESDPKDSLIIPLSEEEISLQNDNLTLSFPTDSQPIADLSSGILSFATMPSHSVQNDSDNQSQELHLIPNEELENLSLTDVDHWRSNFKEASLKRCYLCTEVFPALHHLIKHLRSEHTKNDGPYTCDLCQKALPSGFEFHHHVRFHVKDDFPNKEKYPFSCSECDLSFSSKSSVQLHLKKSHAKRNKVPHVCELCDGPDSLNEFPSLKEYSLHMAEVHEGKPFMCKICDKGYNRKKYLDEHISVKHLNQNIPCNICGKLFGKRFHMLSHKKQAHSLVEEQKIQCETCGVYVNGKKNFKNHVQMHEDDKKMFECSFCSKKFRCKFSMIVHERNHTVSGSTFSCSVCSIQFREVTQLKTHFDSSSHRIKYLKIQNELNDQFGSLFPLNEIGTNNHDMNGT